MHNRKPIDQKRANDLESQLRPDLNQSSSKLINSEIIGIEHISPVSPLETRSALSGSQLIPGPTVLVPETVAVRKENS